MRKTKSPASVPARHGTGPVVPMLDPGWKGRLRAEVERVYDGGLGKSLEAISGASGRSRGWAAQIIRGEIGDIRLESLFQICHQGLDHVSPYWIMTGAGNPMDPPPPPTAGPLAEALRQREVTPVVRFAAVALAENPRMAELLESDWLEILDALIVADRRATEDVERILKYAADKKTERNAAKRTRLARAEQTSEPPLLPKPRR